MNHNKPMNRLCILLVTVWMITAGVPSYGSGACCSVSKGETDSISFTMIRSQAKGHERIEDQMFNLNQDAWLFKAGIPLGKGFHLQFTAGIPDAKLTAHQDMTLLSGSGGSIYGIGLGYEIPENWDRFNLFVSVSTTRSTSDLTDWNGTAWDGAFIISESQAIVLGEAVLHERAVLYGGYRFYKGRNRLKDHAAVTTQYGEREGNTAELLGLRFKVRPNMHFVLERGFGHSKIWSFGLTYSL